MAQGKRNLKEKKILYCHIDADLKEAMEKHSEAYGIPQGAIVNQVLRAVFGKSDPAKSEKEQFLTAGEEMIKAISAGGSLSEKDKEELKDSLRQVLEELSK